MTVVHHSFHVFFFICLDYLIHVNIYYTGGSLIMLCERATRFNNKMNISIYFIFILGEWIVWIV